MADAIIRAATADDIEELTSLKIQWADLPQDPSPVERNEFRRRLAEWISARPDDLVIVTAEHDYRLVGMAWLVLFERVPNIGAGVRMTGDIQSVYVLPSHRRQGIGRSLVTALITAADSRSIPRLTVSSNESATHLYLSAGFTRQKNLLERRLHGQTAR